MPNSLYRDTIMIIKKSTGEKFDDIRASVQGGKKAFYSTDVFIEPGDILIRKIRDNFEEYVILEPNFYEDFHGIEAHYQSDIIRKEKFEKPQDKNIVNNIQYNLDGNSRINNNSIDNSLNNIQETDIHKLIQAIDEAKAEIKSLNINHDEQINALKLLNIVESQPKTDGGYKVLAKSILDALPSAVKVLPSIIKIIEMVSK